MLHTFTLVAFFQFAVPNSFTAVVSYPTLGYTLSAGHLVRLAGIPGACYAMPEQSTTEYLHVQTATAARAVLLSAGGDSPALIYRTQLDETTVPLTETPVATAISPTGSYFAALSSSHLWLYRRSGAVPLATLDVRSLPIPVVQITALLVGDDGDLILNTATGFWYSGIPAAPGASFAFVSIPVAFLRFMPRDHLLIAYEPGQGRVIALHPSSAFAIEPLITPQDSLSPVTGIEFGADAPSIWVTQQTGTLLNYNLSRRQLTSYTVRVGLIASVIAPGVFLWLGFDQHTAILDTTQAVPTVLVVPAVDAEPSK